MKKTPVQKEARPERPVVIRLIVRSGVRAGSSKAPTGSDGDKSTR